MSVDFLPKNFPPFQVHHAKKPPRFYPDGFQRNVIDFYFIFSDCRLRKALYLQFSYFIWPLWAFGAKSRQFGAVTMDNVRDYTFAEAGGFERWMSMLNYQYNNEPEAMRDIMMIYGALRKPVMVLFLTDGRLSSDWEIEEILIKTSRFPIYWQFVGLHGEEYGILERLQEIDGRRSDNAAFLKLDDIDDISDHTLYENLLHNLEGWLREIQYKHILEP